MNEIAVIARMSFLEARRNRVTWSLFFFCHTQVLTSFMFQEVTIAYFDRIVRDVGFAAINLFGVLLAVFLGVNTVTREIERRTVYALLAKPISRGRYLVGKLLGVWLTVAVCLSMMFVAFLFETTLYQGPIDAVMFQAFWLLLVELLLLAAFAILVSTFTSSIMAAFMTLSLVIIGHLSEDLAFFASKSSAPAVRTLGQWTFFVLPNLDRLNLKNQLAVLAPVDAGHVLTASAYGIAYVVAFMALSIVLFSRRDLK
jgi:Cu-processing system permease protein